MEADAACYTGDAYLADWPQTLDNLAAMQFDKLIPGRGPALLTPADGGTRLELKATVEVRIPLVGGKVETFIGNQLAGLLMAEQRFTTAWIRENA